MNPLRPQPRPPKREKRAQRPMKRGKPPARGKAPAKKRRTKRGPVANRRAARHYVGTYADAVWANWVRQRAEYLCELTGMMGTDAHHVWPKGAHPKLRNEIDNGVFLTHEEHMIAHKNMRAFRKWFSAKFPARWARLEAARLA